MSFKPFQRQVFKTLKWQITSVITAKIFNRTQNSSPLVIVCPQRDQSLLRTNPATRNGSKKEAADVPESPYF